MNADRLLSYFDRCDPSGDSLAQIRKLIVSLAISGRLGTTDRVPVVTESRPIQNEDLPFSTLKAERFVRLSTVAEIRKGLTGIQKAKPGKYPLVVTAKERATTDHYDFEGEAAIVPLISSTGHGKASLHRLHYQDGRFAVGNILAAVFPHDPTVVTARFLFEYMTAFKEELLVTRMTGTANVALTVGKLAAIPVPLVSISTQTKVDELMMLCDRLEASQAEREGRRDRLVMASLHRLSQPTDPDEFKKDARFQLSNLNRLATKPEHIKELRKAILNLAVRGKLTSKKSTPSGLPSDWSWSSVEEVGEVKLGRQRSPQDHHGPHMVPYLRVANVYDGYLNLSDVKAMNFTPQEQEVFRLRPGDVLLNEGQSRELVGRPAIYRGEIEGCCFQNTLLRFRCGPSVTNGYALLVFRSYLHCGRFQQAATQTTNMAHLSASRLKAIEFPLPPLDEQKRIVAKVDELMLICDQLEIQLEYQQKGRRKLLEALLHEALGGVG